MRDCYEDSLSILGQSAKEAHWKSIKVVCRKMYGHRLNCGGFVRREI